jgi:hypothetical protein
MYFSTSWLVLLLSVLLAGCRKGPKEMSVRDTEGREFSAACDEGGRCMLQQQRGPRRDDGKTQAVISLPGQLVGVCDVAPGSQPDTPAECRAVVCEEDSDCPPLPGQLTSHCLERVCTDPARPFGPPDAVLLCLAGTGLGRQSPRQVELYALALNCGSPCKLPATCRR